MMMICIQMQLVDEQLNDIESAIVHIYIFKSTHAHFKIVLHISDASAI